MNLKSILLIILILIQINCLKTTKPETEQTSAKKKIMHDEMLLAKILKAEDSRNENELIALEKTLNQQMVSTGIRMAHACGRIPSFKVWKNLFEKFYMNKNITNTLALVCRYPNNKFPKIEIFKTLKAIPLTKIVVETLLYLNIKEAFFYALSIDGYDHIVAANLWRSKDFITEKILKKYYEKYPVPTIYSAYRSRQKKIVYADDIFRMELNNRFYGCLVCDQPEKFLKDRNWQVRIAALRAVNSAEAAKEQINDKNPQIRITAIQIYLKNNGDPAIINLKTLIPWEAEILTSQIKNKQIIKEVFLKGDIFSEVAAPNLSKSDKKMVMSSKLSDKAKIMYMEKQFGKEEAISQAMKLFKNSNSAFALEYLLYQKDGVKKEDIVQTAKQKGLFNSILIDYGYLKRVPVNRPLSFYHKVLNNMKKINGFKIFTEKGTIICRFYSSQAPLTCYNFIKLVKKKYFNDTFFHRVVPAFVTQDGDPSGTGAGGPDYSIRCEYNEIRYDRNGLVGMALSGKDTGGSQYFITHLATPHLNHQYTIFAEVIRGIDVIAELCLYDRIKKILLW